MAVGVVNADGAQNAAETEFLARLATALQLPVAAAADTRAAGERDGRRRRRFGRARHAVHRATAAAAPMAGTVLGKASVTDAEMDKTILKASITNAALELLPESLASMAIIPLQMRLVYRIGKSYGYEMDRSHAKDFIATLGVGLTSQYVEQFGRKLLGGLLGGLGGGLGRVARPPGRQLRPDVRDDVRDRPRRAALLRGRAHARRGDAQGRRSRPCSRRRAAWRRSTSRRSSRPRRRSTRATSCRWCGRAEEHAGAVTPYLMPVTSA